MTQYISRNVNIFVGLMEAGFIKHEAFEESVQHFLPSAFSERVGLLAHARTRQAWGGPSILQWPPFSPITLQNPQRRLC